MTPRETLTPEQVEALLLGGPAAPRTPVVADVEDGGRHARYGCCDRCEAVQPALLTFHGDHDWEPELPADSPVRVVVRALREALGRRTILLCGRCVDTVRAQIPAVPDTHPRLFAEGD